MHVRKVLLRNPLPLMVTTVPPVATPERGRSDVIWEEEEKGRKEEEKQKKRMRSDARRTQRKGQVKPEKVNKAEAKFSLLSPLFFFLFLFLTCGVV